MTAPAPRPPLPVLLGVGLTSGAAVAIQIAFTRALSITLWHHFAYLVIGLALLGFGVAGSLLVARGVAIRPGEGAPTSVLARRARLAAWGTALSFAFSGVVRVNALEVFRDPSVAPALALLAVLSAAPFFGAGAVIATALAAFPKRTGAVYGADLLGAGAGAALSVLALGAVGAVRTTFFAAAALALASACFAAAASRSEVGRSLLALALLAAIAFALRDDDAWVRPATKKEIHITLNHLEHREWNAIGRIDVSKELHTPPTMGGEFETSTLAVRPTRGVTQDGAAPTLLFRWGGGLEDMPFLRHGISSAAHAVRASRPEGTPGRTLVIGVGGGIDVLIALAFGAREVVGVDVNRAMIRLLTEVYADFTGNLARRPDVRLVTAEGRAFVRGNPERFDAIQMSGVDTYAALASGAYAVSEAYLYTVEAVEDYLPRLEEGGLLSIGRFILDPPRETLRLAGIAAEALRGRGDAEPWRSIAVMRGWEWATTLVRRGPFPPEELEALRRFAKENGFGMAFDPERPTDGPFDRYLRADDEGRRAFLREHPYDVSPVGDDPPFFFNDFKWGSLPSLRRRATERIYLSALPVAHGVLGATLLTSVLAAVFGILRPLRTVPKTGNPAPRRRFLLYFVCLGLAYLFAEIAFLQRLTLFLGHPTYALSVALAVLLVSSGAGAAVSGLLPARADRALAWILPAVLVAAAFATRTVLPSLLGLSFPARVAVATALLAPTGFAMGIPFPRGLERLRGSLPPLVPWAFSANAFATVVAATLAVVLAIEIGFTALLLLAAALYLVAFAALPREAAAPRAAAG